jgi:hypothetical protein
VQPGTALHYYDFNEDLEEVFFFDQNGDKVFYLVEKESLEPHMAY